MGKKILLLISSIILIVIGIGTFIYFKTPKNPDGTLPENTFKNFFPFGVSSTSIIDQNNTGSDSTNPNNPNSADETILVPQENLKQVTTSEVSGAFASNSLSGTSVRYVEKVGGVVHEIPDSTKVDEELVATSIPFAYESIFDSTGNFVINRYLDETLSKVQSYLSIVGSNSGQYLPENILALSPSPNSGSYFYITVDDSDKAVGIIFTPNGSKSVKILNSSFTEWNSEWPTVNNIYLTTKPSWNTKGYIYSLNTTTGIQNKVFGGINGLTTKVNQSGSHMLYSETTRNGVGLYVYNIKNSSTLNTNLSTISDKCVFAYNMIEAYCAVPNNSPSSKNPDNWYQGIESFDDSIYKINTNTGDTTYIMNISSKKGIDAVNLFLDKSNNTLYFINKKDSTLWSLGLIK